MTAAAETFPTNIVTRRVCDDAEMAARRLQRNGHLYMDGDWWRLRWRESAIGPDGAEKRIRRSAVIGKAKGEHKLNEKQASRIAWETILSKVDAHTRTPASMMTLESFVEQRFIPDVVFACKHSGKLHYQYCLARITKALGTAQLRAITPSVLQDQARRWLAEGLSVQTVTHYRNTLSAIFSHAKRIGHHAGDNPASLVRLPEMQHARRNALTFEQARVLLTLLESPIREAALLAMTTSMNVAELCGLRWRRVNLTDGWAASDEPIPPMSILVAENYYRGTFGSVKTGRRRRIVPIPAAAAELLAGLAKRPQFAGPDDIVLASRNGTPIDAHNCNNRQFRAAGRQIGAAVTWHVLRHTCATLAEQVAMTRTDRIALLGHASGSMTDRYTHADVSRMREGVERIAERLVVAVETGRVQ